MSLNCTYDFKGPDGKSIRITGKEAFKAYLSNGGLQFLLPKRAEAAGFKRTQVASAISTSPAKVAMIKRMASGMAGTWANPPKVDYFSSLQDANVPQKVREADAKQRADGAVGDPEGFYLGGTAYVSLSLKTPEDVVRVMAHEALGHYGLRGLFGKELDPILRQIIASKGEEVRARKELSPMVAAEEILADMAQTRPELGFVKRAIAAIRGWLRANVPGFADMKLSDEEIIARFILPARAFVEQGSSAGKDMAQSAAFSRTDAFKRWFGDSKVVDADGKPLVVYHGTGADFEAFDKNKSGAVWNSDKTGFFFSSEPVTASEYADFAASQTAGAANVMPAYVSLKNPLTLEKFTELTNGIGLRQRHGNGVNALTRFFDDERDLLLRYAKQEKNDGILLEKDGKQLVVAFRPEQIKSATGNNGDFDGTNPDIRFSRAAPTDTGLTPPEPSMARKLQARIQDNNNRIKAIQDRITKLIGSKIPNYADYYMAEDNRPGRIAARLDDFRNKMRDPLIQRIAKTGHTLAQVEELAHAMHALERNKAVAKINPKHDQESREFIGIEGSGMSTDTATDILGKYASDKAIQDHVEALQKIAKATLDMKLAYGRVTQEQYDAYAAAYDFYVPLKGDGEYGPDVKRAMGHGEREEHILENVMRDYEQSVVTGERNLARQALLQLVLQNPDSDLWTVGVTPKGRYVAGQVYTIVKNDQEVAAFTSQSQVDAFMEAKGRDSINYEVLDERGDRVREFARPLQDSEVPVYVEGQRVRIQIKDEILAGQLRPLNQGQMAWVLEKLGGLNRYLSKIYTGYSPTFLITNPLRDMQTGTVTMLGNYGAGMAGKAWAQYPSAMKALFQYAKNGTEPNTDMGKMLKEYRMNGGKTGASHMSDLEEQGKSLGRLYDDAYGAKAFMADGKPTRAAIVAGRKAIVGMAHVFEVMNQATENGLRLALYVAQRNAGTPIGEAAQAAKNVTVNFDRKGSETRWLSALFLFFNPAVQGTANAMRAIAKGDHKKQAWFALGALASLGAWAVSAGLDDDEDRWLGEGWDTRAKKLVMNIGGTKITVPLSLEFAPFYATGVAIEEARRGATKPMDAAGRIVSSFIDAYVPFKGLFSYDSDNKPMDALAAGMPTVLRPGFEAATNRNVFGSKIVPENEFTKDVPDNLKMNRNTKGGAYDAAAQGMAATGELLGARRYENDISKVSPEMLKHWWRTYTGGLGSFIGDSVGLAKLAAEDASAIEMADVPVVKAFGKAQDVSAIRGRFYDMTKDIRATATEFKQAKKAGDDEAMEKLLNTPSKAELLGLEKLVTKTTKAAAELRDEEVAIAADKTMPLAERRAAIKELQDQEEAIYRQAIEAFK